MFRQRQHRELGASEDGTTFTVHLSAPCAYFYDLCAFPTLFAVQQACGEGAAGAAENPGAWATEAGFVCSGAYKLTSWDHNVSMVYEKNPYYWDAANVKLERLEFMLSDDDTAILAAYNAGNLDFIDTVPTDEIKNLLDNPEFYIADQLGTYYVVFNVKSDLFLGKTVEQANAMRRAFALLIDRQYIIDTVGQTGQQIATAFIPAKMADGHGGEFKVNDSDYTYPDADSVGYFPAEPDVAQAISLLESAGYVFKDGKLDASTPISFEYLTNQTSGHVAIAECVQQDLAAVGIDMSIRSIDWSVFLDERKQGNFDIARNGWVADFNDPINMLEMWTTVSGNNDAQFGRFAQ
jgi:peptide/nickel transport system substrate-binding protein/oligopeptide transport system substrate-binding protein